MLRGDLSNRPAAICGVDFRVLLNARETYAWFLAKIPELLLHKSFENLMRKSLPFKKGAKTWLENNWERRFASVSVGVPVLAPAIDMVLGDYIAESYHFDDVYEFRQWMRQSRALYKVYTDDVLLLGLDDVTCRLSGWTEMA